MDVNSFDPTQGPQAPWVTFEQRTIEDRAQSIATGRYMDKDVDYVQVRQPGTTNCHEDIALDWLDKQDNLAKLGQIPKHWPGQFRQLYAQHQAGVEPTPDGVSLRSWPPISKAQAKNLIGIGIMTVEQLAGVGEEALAKIGMGGRELRQRAQAYLMTADRDKAAARITSLEAAVENSNVRNASLESQIEELRAMVKNLGADPNANRAAQDATSADPIETRPARRGKAAA